MDGKRYTPDDLVEYLLSDPDMLAKVLAYFVRYVETYNLSEDEIRSLAEVFGMTELLGEIEDVAKEHDSSLAQMISDAGGLLNLIIDQIRDGENDPIIGVLLWLANGWLSEKLGTEVDLPALWKKLEAEYQSIRSSMRKLPPGCGLQRGEDQGLLRTDIRDTDERDRCRRGGHLWICVRMDAVCRRSVV